MSLIRIYAITLRLLYLIRGSFSRVLPLFIWVGIDMVLWGFITKYLNRVSESGLNFVPQLLGAVLLWDFFIRVLQGVTMAFLEDVWARNFFNIFASPLTIPEYLSGLILSSILTSAVGLLVMLLLSTSIFGLSYASYGAALAPFLITLFLFGIGMGIAGCAIVLRFGPASEWFIWPIPALIAPFAGVFYPVATLPGWMQAIAHALPPSYVFEGMRDILAGNATAWGPLCLGLGLTLLYILAGCLIFTRVYRYALRVGLIARYSAESLG